MESEVKCCKEAVCVIDMSSFTKFEITVSAWDPKEESRNLCIFIECTLLFICHFKIASVRTLVYFGVLSVL